MKPIESMLFAGMKFDGTFTVGRGADGMKSILDSRTRDEDEVLSNLSENPVDTRLSRYRGVLLFVAHRILNNRAEAEDAVRNCLLSVSYTVPRLESEGAFRSWLVRVLMDEALMILHKKRDSSTTVW
jgi:DNA-directed RNA polymerase specialized sigma24 family protein